MAESGESFVVELQSGVGDPTIVPLYVHTVLDPMSIGRRGMWRVEARGVLDIHGYIYFDGRSLFLQSADPARPVLAQGRAVGRSWTSVTPPCTISVGSARLEFRSTEDDGEHVEDAQTEIARKPPVARPPRPFEPGAFTRRASEDEATQMQPVEDDPRLGVRQLDADAPSGWPRGARPAPTAPRLVPRAGGPVDEPAAPPELAPRAPAPEDLDDAPAMGPLPRMNVGRQAMPSHPSRAGREPATLGRHFGAWDKLSGPQRLVLAMSPFLLMSIYLLFRDEPRPRTIPGLRAAASVPVSVPVNPYAAPAPTRPPVLAPPTTPTPQPHATPPPTSPPVSLPSAGPLPPADRGTAAPAAPTPKTLERTAVDFVTAGQYDNAAQVYDLLAAANPSNAAYREAARILRQKLDAGN